MDPNESHEGLDDWRACATLSALCGHRANATTITPARREAARSLRRIQAGANKLTASEWAELHRRAMQLIYAGTGSKEAVRSGQ